MANPTALVPSVSTSWSDTKRQHALASTAQTYQVGELIGLNASGYATKLDDTASLKYAGKSMERVEVPSGGSNGDYKITVDRPRLFSMLIAATATIADIGKSVFAKYSNEVSLSPGTYGNHVGYIHQIISATEVLVSEVPPTPVVGYKGYRKLAATGNVTLDVNDLNKVIEITGTAAQTITLPAVAATNRGDRLQFVKTSADAVAATLDANASETIDGGATLATIDAAYDCVELMSTGTEWVVLNRDIA